MSYFDRTDPFDIESRLHEASPVSAVLQSGSTPEYPNDVQFRTARRLTDAAERVSDILDEKIVIAAFTGHSDDEIVGMSAGFEEAITALNTLGYREEQNIRAGAA